MEATAHASSESSGISKPAPKWMKRVPMITGVLAGLAGFLTVRSANMSNDAIYQSNQAVLKQAQASDKWAEYQANSVKARIVETALLSAGDPKVSASLQSDDQKFRSQQAGDLTDAKALEDTRDAKLKGSQARLTEKDLLDYAGVAAQLGIALASVAALTKKHTAFSIALFAGVVALGVTACALISHFRTHV